MAKDKITEYDATANNNTVCGDVNIAENSALPSDMNNFAREIMSHLKEGLGSGTPLYVDQTNNRVGINKTPTVALDVSGDADLSGTLDVAGTVTANDITVNGSAVTSLTLNTSVNGSQILFNDGTSGTQPWQVGIRNNGSNDFLIYQSGPENIDIFTDNKLRQTIGSGGDISFYEDTGTTPKFFWDSSAESLAIGNSTVDTDASALYLLGTDPNAIDKGQLVLKGTATSGASDTGASIAFKGHNGSGTRGLGSIQVLKENSTVGNNDTYMRFSTRDNAIGYRETMRIDSSGNVGIGTSSGNGNLTVASTGDAELDILADSDNNGSNQWPILNFRINSPTGTPSARIYKKEGDGALVFDNAGTERMRIDSNGNFLVGTTDPSPVGSGDKGTSFNADGLAYFARLGGTVMVVTRNTNDGTLLSLRQAGTEEGTISVSGTTISYNGGHLSRWSQLTDNTRDNIIVKGTVMTNLDQMAEWTTDGITEDNEQLNCMAVSSVEGDANVAGVFVNWDNDDDIYTNDMNIAMTGDMVIRIAQGTTVARGDLLMSAGDGTAKPQDDDIVRSKTIAKVTSTNVSHTYDDGTYLVPCVLMAC